MEVKDYMLNSEGFDLWADGYDKAVGLSEEENTYPFAGYKKVLGKIYKIIMKKEHPVILDIGFGTGVLTQKLYENGCIVYGQDFSSKMIGLASKKMPNAHFYRGDFTKGLVEPLNQETYDFIIATYSIHHLTDTQKIYFLKNLYKHLNDGGQILIGDVAFETRNEWKQCKEENMDKWDEDEFYCIVEELKQDFPNLSFEKITFCSGVLVLSR